MKEHIMNRQQGFRAKLKSRQHGAVAIIVALSLVVLIGMLGLVLDLGHLYVTKTELQNAADASALSGAKELNGTKLGVQNAITAAVNIARMNNFDLQNKPVGTNAADGGLVISVGNCPDDIGCGWVLASTVGTDAGAVGKYFLKVETGSRSLSTWFIQVLPGALSSTATFGMAVAGRYVTDIAPIGVCAVHKDSPEYGFIRGVAYNLPDLNPLGATAVPMWINPVDIPPATCYQDHASNAFAVPFICTGKSAIDPSVEKVYVSTGTQAALNKSLNVRFASTLSDYNGSGCDSASALPDENIRQYPCTNATGADGCLKNNTTKIGLPREWMEPDPNRQTVWFGDDPNAIKTTVKNLREGTLSLPAWRNALTAEQWGVLWSYTKEVKDFTTSPYTYYNTSDWSTIYSNNTALGYPPSATPYTAIGTNFFQGPASMTGLKERRILNVLIINCPDMSGVNAMSCKELPVLGVGQFFMQAETDVPKYLGAEFVKLLPRPSPRSNIRLYR
jgi:hypothetical protein